MADTTDFLARAPFNLAPDDIAWVRRTLAGLSTADRIGQTLYFKFLAYNAHAGGKQTLDQVVPYAYLVQGTPLTASVPDVTNLAVVFVGDYANLTWDEANLHEWLKNPKAKVPKPEFLQVKLIDYDFTYAGTMEEKIRTKFTEDIAPQPKS